MNLSLKTIKHTSHEEKGIIYLAFRSMLLKNLNNMNLSLKTIKHTSREETGIILKVLNLVVPNLI